MLLKSSYLKFLLKSTNAHGVHSPFVYNLVTQCFYKKQKIEVNGTSFSKELKKNHVQLIDNVFSYLEIKNPIFFTAEKHFINRMFVREDLEKETLVDFVYIEANLLTEHLIEDAFFKLKREGVLVIETPYKKVNLWEKIKTNNHAQIVVDTYFFGFIFTRQTQARESFLIRI